MVDNVAVTAGTGTTIAADDVAGVLFQRVKLNWGPDGTANEADVATGKPLPVQLRSSAGGDVVKAEDAASASGDFGVPILAVRADVPAATSGTDGDYEPLQVSGGMQWTLAMGLGTTCSTDITRPADTTAYAANDAVANSTSAPTAGGFTFTSAARKSGGSCIITDAVILSSNPAGTPLQGEIWLFDSAVTAINDNAAFALSDGDAKLFVGKIAFTLATDATNNSQAHVTGLNIMATCVGSANLRYLVKVKNAYTPISAEVLTVRLKSIYLD